MKITVFTGNQPRHLALIGSLAGIADKIYAVQECTTVFPGQVADFFKKSPVMQDYFSRVINAEQTVFSPPGFLSENVRTLCLKMGDLSQASLDWLKPALDADVFVVFGASYIRGPLCEHLIQRRAINIHMGLSPWYRGSSCNFWAMYDNRPDMVGATLHLLSAGLDNGPMLLYARPEPEAADPFVIGMKAVLAAHVALVEKLRDGSLSKITPVPQDRSMQIRYTRNADFNDAVAQEYLNRLPTPGRMYEALSGRERLAA